MSFNAILMSMSINCTHPLHGGPFKKCIKRKILIYPKYILVLSINTIIGLQGIFELKRLTLHYMNNDQRRMKQEKVETKIFSMSGLSASKDLADAKSTKI